MIINPLLVDIPQKIYTPRLLIRAPQIDDGIALNQAINESFSVLSQWMDWATHMPTLEESELNVRASYADWIMRKNLPFFIFSTQDNTLVGATGLHHIDWSIPKFETGYWIRSTYQNQGIITEAVNALMYFTFIQLHAQRVEIRCDQDNKASIRIAQKLNFTLEGTLINERRKINGLLRNTCIYACYNEYNLPKLKVKW
ncbi:GNAT family N-acetyltransferase [Vermiphilus pyriformis]|nr:MAG: GNAT family N-acetyltransferase [Vermiphilus pyriformis]